MPLQRVRDAENRMRNKLSNGPRRVQSNVNRILSIRMITVIIVSWIHRVFCNVKAYVSCRGYRGILIRAQVYSCEYKVAPRIVISTFVLDRKSIFLSGIFFTLRIAVSPGIYHDTGRKTNDCSFHTIERKGEISYD